VQSFVVQVPVADVDIASDLLWQLGVRAVEERPTDRGDVELWTAVGDDPEAISRAVARLGGRWRHRLEPIAASADTWRSFAQPVWVADDLVVVPAWQDAPADAGTTVLRIEPGAAFGLGDHPTTLLSLRALRTALAAPATATSVLDVGCGTGVLAVAAALAGVPRIRAVDVSSAAVAATVDNARRNGVEGRIDVDTTPLAAVEGSYDVVVANILAPTLIELAPELRRTTGTTLVISGILADRHEHVLDALRPLQAIETIELDGWVAVTLR